MSLIYFYLPRHQSIATPLPEFINRWGVYARAVRDFENKNSEITLLLNCEYSAQVLDGLNVVNVGKWRLSQTLKILSIIRKQGSEATLVAGNNYDALAVALIIRLFKRRLKVQASIHSEVAAIFTKNDLRAAIKRLIIGFLVPKVDSLRVVREQEVEKVASAFQIDREKIFVCPVPIELPEISMKNNEKSVGYLGRIHYERSPLSWCEIALTLLAKIPSCTFLIAGVGPEEAKMRELLSPVSSQVTFLGHLSGEKLEHFWRSVKVLLITAPFESYGLAGREALLRGVSIVVPEIEVYRELKALAPSLVKLFNTKEEAALLLEESLSADLDSEEIQEFRKIFIASQREYLKALANSWV